MGHRSLAFLGQLLVYLSPGVWYQAAREEALAKKMEEELVFMQRAAGPTRSANCRKEQRFSAELQRWAEQQQEAPLLCAYCIALLTHSPVNSFLHVIAHVCDTCL